MEIYLLKFSACLFLFMIFYKIFLEKESFHEFKRYYLLGIILLSAAIPLITFTQYVEITPTLQAVGMSPSETLVTIESSSQYPNYLPIILWSLYGLGVLVFGTRFFLNLFKIYKKIKCNPNHKNHVFIHVLLKEVLAPHTFFKYIFLNKYKFENHQIPEEVLLHEQTHAREKHTMDILFIEILQIIMWFNPLLYLLKKDIKLNHEFLADRAVLHHGIQPAHYQHLLLEYSSHSNTNQLANAFNYSFIKKRFTVMKTQTSKTTIWLKSLILLPLLAFMVYGFSSTKEVFKSTENLLVESSDYTARSISINVLEDGTYLIDGLRTNKNSIKTVVNKLHQDITPEVRKNIMNIHVSSSNQISNEEIWFIYDSLLDYGFYRLVADNQEVVKGKGNTPFLNTQTLEDQQGASKKQIEEYNTWAKSINQKMAEAEKKDTNGKWVAYPIVKQKDVVKFKNIYDNVMTESQRRNVEPWPSLPPPPPPPAPKEPAAVKAEVPPPPPIPENATAEQRQKYEEATRAYKLKTEKVKQKAIKEEKLKREKEKYAASQTVLAEAKLAENAERQKQAETQRAVLAEVRIADRKELSEAKKAELIEAKKAYVAEKHVQREQLKQEKLKYEKERKSLTQEQKVKRKEALRQRESEQASRKESYLVHTKRNPLDHIIDMSKKGALFYFEGKEISSDKAIEIAKSNKYLNIKSNDGDSKQTKVYLIVGKPVIKD